MKVLGLNLVKSSIMNLIHTTRDVLYVCTYSYDLTSLEVFEFIQLIERKGMINFVAGKELPPELLSKLARLYNIRVYHNPKVHAKIYLNEDEAIVTSCNFGNLTVPRLYECGVLFSKREFKSEHLKLEEQMKFLMSEANMVIPLMPFKHEKGIDLREFI
jgi:hypothetical protein